MILNCARKFINDQPDNMTHKFELYADDGKLKVELGTDRDDDDMQFGINKIVVLGIFY